MSYSISQLKNDLEGMLHGTTLDQITALDSLINRAARQLLMDVDPQETKRIEDFPDPIFDGVYDYPSPADLKGNKVIDIRPQVSRTAVDNYIQTYNKTFDLTKIQTNQPEFTINFNTGIKSLRLASPQLQAGIVINQANTSTSNGTWAVGGNASTLTNDNINWVSGGSSLQFDLDSTGIDPSTGYLECTGMTAVDLSDMEDQGTFFLYTYLPNPTDIDSVKLTWGSSSTDYWERTATVTQVGSVFQTGWNLLQFDWLGATSAGSPDSANVDYLKVTYTYDGTLQTAVHLNNITCRMGAIMEIEYYSKFLFRDAITGAFQETVTDDSNLINLDTESYNLLTYQVGLLAIQQQSGAEGSTDYQFMTTLYAQNLRRYKDMYKSEITQPQQAYYNLPNNNYRRWFGRRP